MFENAILWPREQSRYANDTDANLLVNEGRIQIGNLPAFELPDNPDWTEDPYSSRSWSAYYQSLGWLYAGEYAYLQGNFTEFPEYAKSILLDFMADNPDPSAPSHELTWHDGATAFRLATISYLYDQYFKADNVHTTGITFTPEEEQLFAQSLQNHVSVLEYNLSVPQWQDNNHRFFHGMALASYGSVFGNAEGTGVFDDASEIWFLRGLFTIDDILGNLIDIETGISREQSFAYHRLAMGLILEADDAIYDVGYILPHDYQDVLAKMVEFDVLSATQGNKRRELVSSEVGDTAYGSKDGSNYLRDAIDQGFTTPYADYVLSEGQEGIRPPDVLDYSAGGYIIFRPEYEWENVRDTRVLFDVSEAEVSHGHFDNTNVLLSAYGEKILVDSGGPYSYDHTPEAGLDGPFRELYFETSRAHNVLTVDGQSFDAPTRVLTIQDAPLFSYAAASHTGYEHIEITRHLIELKGGVTLLFDVAENSAALVHDYRLPFHFAPTAEGVDAAAQGSFSIGRVDVDTAYAGGGALQFDVISGRLGDTPQGWVSRDFYDAIPAPVLGVSQLAEDAWFASAFGVSRYAPYELLLEVERTADGFEAVVSFANTDWVISLHGTEINVDRTFNFSGNSQGNDIDGSEFGDVLNGKGGEDTLFGGDGDDTIVGGSGDDSIIGHTGNDSITGGTGFDVLLGGSGDDWMDGGNDDDYLSGYDGNDTLLGGNGDDELRGGLGTDELFGGAGRDKLYGNEEGDYLNGYDGNDQLYGGAGTDTLLGGAGSDRLYGEAGDDLLYGNEGTDTLIGGLGQDALRGDEGDDLLYGGGGDDTLDGGQGRDRLYGSTGADVFVFSDHSHSVELAFDRIGDFEQGIDKIDLRGLGYIGVTPGVPAEGQLRLVYSADSDRTYVRDDFSDFEFSLENGDYRAALTQDDFIFL